MQFIPGHRGVLGNEAADSSAKASGYSVVISSKPGGLSGLREGRTDSVAKFSKFKLKLIHYRSRLFELRI
ncbi:Ribonuclease H domain [Trinorchestia longiramus]|nr:Ribonuclease H domain [Trinorchestia longiramus]